MFSLVDPVTINPIKICNFTANWIHVDPRCDLKKVVRIVFCLFRFLKETVPNILRFYITNETLCRTNWTYEFLTAIMHSKRVTEIPTKLFHIHLYIILYLFSKHIRYYYIYILYSNFQHNLINLPEGIERVWHIFFI